MSGLLRVNLPSSENAGLTRHAISRVEKTIVDMIFEQDILPLLSGYAKQTERYLW
jgi:hypothetical protein